MSNPSGAAREVGIHKILFSATNARGLISETNAAFAALVGVPRKRLLGTTPEIMRHPFVPAGVALAMHEALAEGQVVCGYLDQRDDLGRSVRTFTVITPQKDGRLALQVRPGVETELQRFDQCCAGVSSIEDVFRGSGAVEDVVARAGQAQLEALLHQSGHGGLQSFTRTALPAEVRHRAQLRNGCQWPSGDDGYHRLLLAETRWLGTLLQRWLPQLDGLHSLTSSLAGAAHRLDVIANSAGAQAQAFDHILTHNGIGQQAFSVRQWIGSAHEQRAITDEYRATAQTLVAPLDDAQWQLALAVLHGEALTHAAVELCEEALGPMPTRRAMRLLLTTIDQTIPTILRRVGEVVDRVHALGEFAARLSDLTATRIDLLEGWQRRAGSRFDEGTDRLRPEVADALREDQGDQRFHTHLATRCRSIRGLDGGEFRTQLEKVSGLVEALT